VSVSSALTEAARDRSLCPISRHTIERQGNWTVEARR
jgi:hypothetical protein